MSRLFLLAALLAGSIDSCTFTFEKTATVKYYREDGWFLPGIKDYKFTSFDSATPLPPVENIEGAQARVLLHEYPYIVEFPAQITAIDGETRRLRPMVAKAGILRWEMNGKVFAYSYGLIPLDARREGNRWKIESEAGCIFTATFIDDRGDGVFRLMVQRSLAESLVPAWVRKPEGD